MRMPIVLAVIVSTTLASAQSWLPTSFDPPWKNNGPTNVVSVVYNSAQSSAQNGQALFNALTSLTASQDLSIGPGTYLLPTSKLSIGLTGTAANPVWIYAANPTQRPVLMRSNAGSTQNILNVGETVAARYMAFRDLEITHQQPAPSGSDIVRLYNCQNIWIENCYLHDGGGVGIAANSNNTQNLYITRNEILRPAVAGATGEGMYLGANFGAVTMSDSVIALNHVHQVTAGSQGDGIEVKHGSFRNWIVDNHVHNTRFPCILVGGTGTSTTPNFENVVERNLMYDSMDNVLQVQGDAIVRNNIAIYSQNSGAAAFQSFNHQGPPRNLLVTHNTFVNTNRAARMTAWSGAPNITFANNACYSQLSNSLFFSGGSTGVTLAGNVAFGTVAGATSGFVTSTSGLADFANVSWTGTAVDVTPALGSVLDNHGSAAFVTPVDILQVGRFLPADPGARENQLSANANTYTIPAATGGTQLLTCTAGSIHANRTYFVLGTVSGINPPTAYGTYELPLVSDSWFNTTVSSPNSGPLQNTLGMLTASGAAPTGANQPSIVLPPLSGASITFWHAFTVWDASNNLVFASNPVPLVFQ